MSYSWLREGVESAPITRGDLDQIENYADRLFAKVGIDVEFTRHFLDRVNDERNKRQITMAELTRLFKQEYKKYGKKIAQLGPDAEAVMKDMRTDVNMPFILRWDSKNQELDLVAKTVMRKKDFRTPDPEFAVEAVDSTPHLFLDMDGVQADFFGQWAKWYSEKLGKTISSYRDIGDAEAQLASIMELTSQGPEFVEDFFATLEPLKGFVPVLNWIKKHNIPYSILSAPLRGNNKASIAGKKSLVIQT
jgi:hypothetical protein